VSDDGGVPKLRFRRSSAATVAAIIVMIAGTSVATWQPYLLILEVIPLAVAIWTWRAGTDVDAQGITVRAALGQRHIPWAEITELRPSAGNTVEAVLTSGGRIALTAVPADRLPAIAKTAEADTSEGSATPLSTDQSPR
jgi:hypothetical protein